METTPLPLANLLRPPGLPMPVSDAVYEANLKGASEADYVEAAFRTLHAAWDRMVHGQMADPNDVVLGTFYQSAVLIGPAFWQQVSYFAKPRRAAGTEARELTIVDALRYLFARAGRDAIYAAQGTVLATVRDATALKAALVGILGGDRELDIAACPPELVASTFDASTLFAWTFTNHGSPATELKVDDLEYAGLSDSMKGKSASIRFGWYADPWRVGAKAKPKVVEAVKDSTPAAPNGTVGTAPSALAEVPQDDENGDEEVDANAK